MAASVSTYPSTATLAAFRRAIGRPNLDTERNVAFPKYPPIHRNGIDGAWSWEKSNGIGARGYLKGASAAFDRREASALRSRAFDRIYDGPADGFQVLVEAIWVYAPR